MKTFHLCFFTVVTFKGHMSKVGRLIDSEAFIIIHLIISIRRVNQPVWTSIICKKKLPLWKLTNYYNYYICIVLESQSRLWLGGICRVTCYSAKNRWLSRIHQTPFYTTWHQWDQGDCAADWDIVIIEMMSCCKHAPSNHFQVNLGVTLLWCYYCNDNIIIRSLCCCHMRGGNHLWVSPWTKVSK